jgi:1-acyl-sn-glycerol-3-phosphate acyltransferase
VAALGALHSVRDACADPARGVSLAILQALVVGAAAVLIPGAAPGLLGWALVGLALALLALFLQQHPFRRLGLVPFGATFLAVGLLWATVAGGATPFSALLLALAAGLVELPLLIGLWASDGSLPRKALVFTAALAVSAGVGWGCVQPVDPFWPMIGLTVAAFLGAAAAWPLWLRPVVEMGLDTVAWPMYRVRGHGPGVAAFPRRGGVLVVANHTTYADPVFLGKVLPRPIRALMTSFFFDRPVMRWFMVHVFRAIRVQQTVVRREAPELAEAVAALRAGEVVVVFPEGRLRRTAEPLLGAFGQGVWRVLKEVPQVPVVVLWVEGGWGSYLSYFNGPPTKNKRLDRRRPIDLAVAAPTTLPPEVLADHRSTRAFFRRAVLECRRLLGLDVPPDPCGCCDEGDADADTPH